MKPKQFESENVKVIHKRLSIRETHADMMDSPHKKLKSSSSQPSFIKKPKLSKYGSVNTDINKIRNKHKNKSKEADKKSVNFILDKPIFIHRIVKVLNVKTVLAKSKP